MLCSAAGVSFVTGAGTGTGSGLGSGAGVCTGCGFGAVGTSCFVFATFCLGFLLFRLGRINT